MAYGVDWAEPNMMAGGELSIEQQRYHLRPCDESIVPHVLGLIWSPFRCKFESTFPTHPSANTRVLCQANCTIETA